MENVDTYADRSHNLLDRAEALLADPKNPFNQRYRIGRLALEAGLREWSNEDLKAAFAMLEKLGKPGWRTFAQKAEKPKSV